MTKSQSQTQGRTSNAPWKEQQDPLKQAFSGADTAYQKAQTAEAPENFVAQATPEQLNNFQQMAGYGDKAATLAGTAAGVGTDLANSGSGILNTAAGGLLDYKPTGGVDTNIAAAGQYADNPYISGAVDAAMRDANRQVYEQGIPSNYRNAAASGNLNSSKPALTEGVMLRGLADRTADVSNAFRQDAWNTGLKMAESGRQFDNNAILNALKGAGALGASETGLGLSALGNSVDMSKGIFDIAQRGGAGLQNANQLALDNELQQYKSDVNAPFDAVRNYYGIVGDKQWGSEGKNSSTTTTTPSTLSTIGAGLGILGSII